MSQRYNGLDNYYKIPTTAEIQNTDSIPDLPCSPAVEHLLLGSDFVYVVFSFDTFLCYLKYVSVDPSNFKAFTRCLQLRKHTTFSILVNITE